MVKFYEIEVTLFIVLRVHQQKALAVAHWGDMPEVDK